MKSLSQTLAIAAVFASPMIAVAEGAGGVTTPDISACSRLQGDAARLACYDELAKNPSPTADIDGSTKTSDIIKPSPPTEYKIVDAEDMYVAPGKYMNRGIEMRNVRCFHADKSEYRCLGNSRQLALMLISPEVTPSSEQSALEDQCGEIKKMMSSPKCQKNIRFTPIAHEDDIVGGYQKRVVIGARSMEILPQTAAKKKK